MILQAKSMEIDAEEDIIAQDLEVLDLDTGEFVRQVSHFDIRKNIIKKYVIGDQVTKYEYFDNMNAQIVYKGE